MLKNIIRKEQNAILYKQVQEDRKYVWDYFSLHAQQRLTTFNFFIVLITLLLGTLFTLIKEHTPNLIPIISLFMIFFSFIFWRLDQRNRNLIHHAESELKKIEKKLNTKVFINEEKKTDEIKNYHTQIAKHHSYSYLFNLVFILFACTGFVVFLYSVIQIQNNSNKMNDYHILIDLTNFYNFKEYKIKVINNGIIFLVVFLFSYFFIDLLCEKKWNKKILFSTIIAISITGIFNFKNFIKVNMNNSINAELVLKNENRDSPEQKKLLRQTKIFETYLYFDIGEAKLLDKVSTKNFFYDQHVKNLDALNNFCRLLNPQNKYTIKITGHSSIEQVVKYNKYSNNYEISEARANNTKEYILNKLNTYSFPKVNLGFDIFAKSNEVATTNQHDNNRKVFIEIYLIQEIEIQ